MREDHLSIVVETESTNDDALALGRAGAAHGRAVAARLQRAGRGRRAHVWESPRGNLHLSVVLRARVAPTRLPGLGAACALGALDGLAGLVGSEVSNEVQLKWPNDLLARGRKLGGLLVEAARDEDGEPFSVCGIGVNVGRAPRGLGAISLTELGAAPSFSALAEALRAGIAGRVDAWTAAGCDGLPLDGVLGDYVARLAWRGEKVRVLAADGAELARGTFEAVDAWGRAVVDGTAYLSELASLRPLP